MTEMKEPIWRSDTEPGKLYHDACFAEDETRDGYTKVERLVDVEEMDCAACGGPFLAEPDIDTDDDDDEE